MPSTVAARLRVAHVQAKEREGALSLHQRMSTRAARGQELGEHAAREVAAEGETPGLAARPGVAGFKPARGEGGRARAEGLTSPQPVLRPLRLAPRCGWSAPRPRRSSTRPRE